MPMYEIVLRFPDRDEVRLTDRNGYRSGEEILIAGRRFRVTGNEPPEAPSAEDRFVLEPCDDPHGPATSARATPPSL
jgi:hypothetical protein